MYCPECGTKNEPNAKFCKKCGHKLSDQQNASAKESVQTTSSSDDKKVVETSIDSEIKRSQKKGHGWIWAIIVLLIMVGIGIAGWMYIFSSPTSSSSTSGTRKIEHSSGKSRENINSRASDTNTYKSFTPDGVKELVSGVFDGVSGEKSVCIGPTDTKIPSYSLNDAPQRAASDIKLYVMATVFSQVKQGKFNMNDTYTLKDSDKVGGTGKVQNMSDGTKFSMQELMDYMMQNSDNTAANIIIRKLGGLSVVNDEISHLGFKDTKVERYLMDTDALKQGKDNMTSVNDLATILTRIYNRKLISDTYDEQMLQILKQDQDHSKLLKEVPEDVTTYNKTGDYPDYGVQNDAAILTKNGRSYVVVAMLEKGNKDDQTSALNDLGKQVYEKYLED